MKKQQQKQYELEKSEEALSTKVAQRDEMQRQIQAESVYNLRFHWIDILPRRKHLLNGRFIQASGSNQIQLQFFLYFGLPLGTEPITFRA